MVARACRGGANGAQRHGSWKTSGKPQRLGQVYVLRAEPQPHDAALGASERGGLGLELQGMIVVANKLKAAFGIGAGALALIVHNKVPLQ